MEFGLSWLTDDTSNMRLRDGGELRELPSAHRTVGRCSVCGFTEIITDEVVDRGWILLAECPHCDHRWTETLQPALAVDAPAPRGVPAPVRIGRPAAPVAA